MLNAIAKFFASPEDKDPSFIRVTRNILIVALVGTLMTIVVVALTRTSRERVITVSALVIAALLEFVSLLMALRGSLAMAKAVLPVVFIFTITVVSAYADTIHDISIVAYPMVIMMATFLQGRRLLVSTTFLTVVAIVFLGILDMTGRSASPLQAETGIDDIMIGAVVVVVTAGILNLFVDRLRTTLLKAETNERAQFETNQELEKLKVSLEQRVQERTSELTERGLELESANREIQKRAGQFEAVAQVTQDITSIRDLQELLPRIAAVISDNFSFYHVGVFLLDEMNEYAVLSATNSEGGRKMMARKHRLRVGEQGIVGNVASTGKPRVAMDVGADAVFFNNLELPNTHSEMALPLKSSGKVIGALDVQSTERGAFTEDDIRTLSLLANQVSLAIENARLFDETRRALAESEAVSRQTTREAWRSLPIEQNILGYRYTIAGVSLLDKPVKLTGADKSKVQPEDVTHIVVPIELRGETIGNLVVQSPTGSDISQDQLDLIKAVAERVAISAENARLFDETTRRAERERTVSDITSKIRSVNDPQAMIRTAIEELRNALGASRVEVIPQTIKGTE